MLAIRLYAVELYHQREVHRRACGHFPRTQVAHRSEQNQPLPWYTITSIYYSYSSIFLLIFFFDIFLLFLRYNTFFSSIFPFFFFLIKEYCFIHTYIIEKRSNFNKKSRKMGYFATCSGRIPLKRKTEACPGSSNSTTIGIAPIFTEWRRARSFCRTTI